MDKRSSQGVGNFADKELVPMITAKYRPLLSLFISDGKAKRHLMNKTDTFKLSVVEHFEDWYVADISDDKEYSSLDSAVNALELSVDEILRDNKSMLSIDEFITTELDFDDFEEELGDFSAGIHLGIVRDEEEIVSVDIHYDYVNKTKAADEYEFVEKELSAEILRRLKK